MKVKILSGDAVRQTEVRPRGAASRAPSHAFWIIAGLVGFSIVFCGFAPSYYLRHWFRTTPLPGLLQLHGALMTSWFVLFFVQVSLIAKHRLAVHRRLGIAGATLAGIIVVVGTFTALRFLRNNLDAPPAFGPPAPEFFGFLLFDLYVFGGLVASAILLRKNREAHRRLMLLATLSMISPGVVRIPFERLSPGLAFLGSGGPGGLFALDLLLLYACIAYDSWRTKRIHPAFIVGGAFIAFGDSSLLGWLVHTGAWHQFAASLVN
jgi:hypothetical protein